MARENNNSGGGLVLYLSMKLATSAAGYFQALGDAGVKNVNPFANMGQSGVKLPGLVPLMAGAGAVGMALPLIQKKPVTQKSVKKLVKKEIERAQKAKTGPGLNGISFFN